MRKVIKLSALNFKLSALNIILMCMFCVSVSAQSEDRQALRDSLAKATEELAFNADSVDLRLKKAAWNIQLQEWQFAKDEYDKILAQNPYNIAALYYRAFVNEKLGRYNFARLDYENLLRIVPGNFQAQLGYAILNEKDKHYTEAMDQMNRLVSQYPDSAVAYAVRAGMEKSRGMTAVAEYDYTEAIKRDPQNTDYILARAEVYITEKKYSHAKADLDRLVVLGVPRISLKEYYKMLR